MPFIKDPKIHRIGKEEVENILIEPCFIQEKIDGANTSIWMEEGEIKCASRNQPVTGGFNGFFDYVRNHEGIMKCLQENPDYRLYGEWLVKHTISYNELSYKHWYLFDIMVGESFITTDEVYAIANTYDLKTPKLFGYSEKPTIEMLKDILDNGKSDLGSQMEGLVIKAPTFVNKFGEKQYAKLVTEKFKEDNAICFGGNNKHSDSYWEIYVCNKYITLPRVEKIINKIQPTIDERMDMKHIPRVPSTVSHDMLTEEIWEIASKVPEISFKKLQYVCSKKAKQIYIDIINNDISVRDK
ncbi:MAG: hypothetical protein HGA25_03090, partial [Clostridiales bacterium]|nr:hypothetical protein [Clostridiales bacterium]